jgi:leucyl/phenylalanyl-tRNA---protein transferase
MNFNFSKYFFPHPDNANEEGLLAISKEFNSDIIKTAYYNGIFPWSKVDEYFTWWSPDPRMVLFPKEIYISKSMKKLIATHELTYSFNEDFDSVIDNCAKIERKDQEGTWIEDEFKREYKKLHQEGLAHSVEVWKNDQLVGGLYGLIIGDVFFGESMFSTISNASKFALVKLSQTLGQKQCSVIDCQSYTDHLASMGAREIPRDEYLDILLKGRDKPNIELI